MKPCDDCGGVPTAYRKEYETILCQDCYDNRIEHEPCSTNDSLNVEQNEE